MVATASHVTYLHLIHYGENKVRLRLDRLFLQAFMAGVYVGMSGHAATAAAGSFSITEGDPFAISKSTRNIIYALVFPAAFIAIIMTGAELFTGNTMTMLICLFEKRITIFDLLWNWLLSFIGNAFGTIFSAYFFSYLTGEFEYGHAHTFIMDVTKKKVSYSFGNCFLRGVGCNIWVCLAVWFVSASDDWASKVLTFWPAIVSFVVSGFEHIVANFYTLTLGLLLGTDVSVGSVLACNLIPTLLGNLVGGGFLIGGVYYYNFYPTVSEDETHEVVEIEGQFWNRMYNAFNFKKTADKEIPLDSMMNDEVAVGVPNNSNSKAGGAGLLRNNSMSSIGEKSFTRKKSSYDPSVTTFGGVPLSEFSRKSFYGDGSGNRKNSRVR